MRLIMELADRANPYIDAKKPWVLAKQPGSAAELQDVCTVGLNLFRQIVVYLSPVLPKLAEQAGALLNDPITQLGPIAAAAGRHAGRAIHVT